METTDMLTTATGNLLRADVDALVNTVNTVGIMGKGIALQFRRAYPDMFDAYAKACKSGEVRLGQMHVWETGALDGPRFIINFPTKGHWRSASKLRDIESGLTDLIRVVTDREITSIAIPPLGCGNGGLDWADVEPLIGRAFAELPEVDVRVYPPGDTPAASDMPTAGAQPRMTHGRAALVALIDRYSRVALGATPIESQKLMYFMQVLGEPLHLNFAANRYGPYADNLRHVLREVEGHYLVGFGDGDTPALSAEPIRPLPGAADHAARVLEHHPATAARVEHVLRVVDGFESMYGMELVATVHWVAHTMPAIDTDVIITQVREWSPRKRRLFTEEHIRIALDTLADRDLLPATTSPEG